MSTSRGVRRRESFDEVTELYDRARPGHPHHLVEDLVDYTALGEGCLVLEIGSGTTFSDVLAFDEHIRTGFLACIADLIQSQFDGRILRHDLYDLWLARTST